MTNLVNNTARETAKQDRSGARTANDVIRRFPDLDKVQIKAGQIELEGYTTINNGFQIDSTGDMSCNNATITNATITNATITNASIKTVTSPSYSTINLSSEETDYEGLTSNMYPAILELHNYYTDGGAEVIEPQVRLDWTVTGDYTTLGAGGCYSPSFTQTSLEERKKNFEKLNSGLDILKDVEIYKYNLKSENDGDKKHYGFVIGNDYKYREELTDMDNKGVDLYSFISVCCKAIQEQQEEIENLRKLVKNDKN